LSAWSPTFSTGKDKRFSKKSNSENDDLSAQGQRKGADRAGCPYAVFMRYLP
jgi:hypothetical protein